MRSRERLGAVKDLSPDDVTSIVQRAAEIDGLKAFSYDRGMEPTLVEASALEAGISVEAVRQAMREHQLVRADLQSRRSTIRVGVPRHPEDVSAALDSYLHDAGFAPVARGDGVSIWEPSASSNSKSSRLAGVSTVSVSIADEGGVSTVAISVDGRTRRLLHVGGASAGGAVAALGGWAAAGGAWPMTVFVGGAGLALVISQLREATSGHRRRMRQAVVGLESFLRNVP